MITRHLLRDGRAVRRYGSCAEYRAELNGIADVFTRSFIPAVILINTVRECSLKISTHHGNAIRHYKRIALRIVLVGQGIGMVNKLAVFIAGYFNDGWLPFICSRSCCIEYGLQFIGASRVFRGICACVTKACPRNVINAIIVRQCRVFVIPFISADVNRTVLYSVGIVHIG